MHKKIPRFIPPIKTSDWSDSPRNWVECLCPTRWEQLNSRASSQILMSKCASYDLAFGVCKLSHTSDHICTKDSSKVWECPNVNWTFNTNTCHFYMNINKTFHFTKIDIFGVHTSLHRILQTSIGVNTLTWVPNTTKKHDHFSLWHVFTHSNHLQIARLICPCWLDVYSCFYYYCGWMSWVRLM